MYTVVIRKQLIAIQVDTSHFAHLWSTVTEDEDIPIMYTSPSCCAHLQKTDLGACENPGLKQHTWLK